MTNNSSPPEIPPEIEATFKIFQKAIVKLLKDNKELVDLLPDVNEDGEIVGELDERLIDPITPQLEEMMRNYQQENRPKLTVDSLAVLLKQNQSLTGTLESSEEITTGNLREDFDSFRSELGRYREQLESNCSLGVAKTCQNCGSELLPLDRYCSGCGTEIEKK